MSWKHHRGDRRGYHHGNLREALIKSALELIADKGPSGFTFAEAARCAGVSPAAPYRHFRDRDELLSDVAQLGFERFAAALEAASREGGPAPIGALQAMGRAYLRFAREEPAFYAAMFGAGKPAGGVPPKVAAAGQKAFEILYQAAGLLCAQLPESARPPALMVAMHIWALSHGIASLVGAGATSAAAMSPEDLLEAGVLVYLRGLGLAGGALPS